MKKAGLISGLGPESTVEYYKGINQKYQERTGRDDTFPKFTLENVDVFECLRFLDHEDKERLAEELLRAIRNLYMAGADFGAITANTPHIVFEEVQKASPIPLVSLIEATCEEARKRQVNCVGLLGTTFTMREDFYKKVFEKAGIEIVVPDEPDLERIGELIMKELERGIFRQETKDFFLHVIDKMKQKYHIEGVILGCTEIPLLLKADDVSVACFDTVEIHINSIVEHILGENINE